MLKRENVHCDWESVPGVEFNVDTIYIRTNIKKEYNETLQKDLWVYNEEQYTYYEFLEVLNSKVDKSETEQNTKITDLEVLNAAQDDMIFEQSYEIAMLKLNSANAV